jgi:protein-tyrosine phosphatase
MDYILVHGTLQNTNTFFFSFSKILPNLLPKIHNILENEKKNVLVCCSAGKSRSATIIVAYLMKHRSMTFEKAMEFVKERRSININPGFLKRLKFH